MFTQIERPGGRELRSQLVSVAVHCLLLIFILWPARAIFVRPSSLAAGGRGQVTELINLPQEGFESAIALPRPTVPATPSAKHPVVTRRRNPDAPTPPVLQASSSPTPSPVAGSQFGSDAYGDVDGHEVRPALPTVFPDPVVSRSEIPDGIAGDVVVEVTIDVQGNVIETRILKPFGYGVEDKVIAVLRNWRFRPATRDGVPIASQQDVYFHFPS